MKKYQVDHCKDRVSTIYYEKNKALEKECTIKGRYISPEKKVDLIRTGKVKLRSNKDIAEQAAKCRWGNGLTDYFDFSKYCWDEHKSSDYARRDKILRQERERVLDMIILGDCKEMNHILNSWKKSKIKFKF